MRFARQVLVVVWFSVSCSVFAAESPGPKRHQVFAHYMVCFAAQGEGVDDYKREIQEAQAAGIDGFALNCGAWHNEPHYPLRVKAIYQAAQELKAGFKLFFSVDFAGLKQHPPGEFESYVLDMVKTYGQHPNQLLVEGRTVVSTFTGEQGIAWKEDILGPLKAAGYDVFLVPFFYYIEWYKTGRQPPLKEALFWFYRVHPKDSVAANDRPVTALHGQVADVLYVTAMMNRPAELHVDSGGTKSVHPLGIGIQHVRIPFSCGTQHFAVSRGGKTILSKDGEPIADRIESYDFFPASGFAYAP